MQHINWDSPIFWIAIIATPLLVAMLTYFFSGKNIRQTIWFVAITALVLLLAIGHDALGVYLERRFIGYFDHLGVPYFSSRTGWHLLLDAWPLWVMPGIVFILLGAAGSGFVLHRLFQLRALSFPRHIPMPPQATPVSRPTPSNLSSTSSELVAKQLELDMFKRALATTNEKLAQAILIQRSEEKKVQELQEKLKQFQNRQ